VPNAASLGDRPSHRSTNRSGRRLTRSDLGKLQALPFEQITAAQGGGGPVVDGVAVPRDL
jgi:hypothetical protein